MTSRDLTLLGYLAIASTVLVLEVVAIRGSRAIATFGQVLGRVMRTRAGRIGVLAGWAWFGLHLFAR
ncbi:MAG: DUF6186 family protein [Planctomycetaceae bacterium]